MISNAASTPKQENQENALKIETNSIYFSWVYASHSQWAQLSCAVDMSNLRKDYIEKRGAITIYLTHHATCVAGATLKQHFLLMRFMRISKETKCSPGSSWAHARCISWMTAIRRAAPSASRTSQFQRSSGAVPPAASWSPATILGGVMARQASVETQFGANCIDRMKLGEWANTSQIPQARTNLKISFLSSRHEVNLSSLGPVLISRIKTGASPQKTWYSIRISRNSAIGGPTVNGPSGGRER